MLCFILLGLASLQFIPTLLHRFLLIWYKILKFFACVTSLSQTNFFTYTLRHTGIYPRHTRGTNMRVGGLEEFWYPLRYICKMRTLKVFKPINVFFFLNKGRWGCFLWLRRFRGFGDSRFSDSQSPLHFSGSTTSTHWVPFI